MTRLFTTTLLTLLMCSGNVFCMLNSPILCLSYKSHAGNLLMIGDDYSPSSSSSKVNNSSFRHTSPWNHLPTELRKLLILHTYHTSDHTHINSPSFDKMALYKSDNNNNYYYYNHCHQPLLLLSSTPGSKLVFSTNLFSHCSTFHPPQ